MMGNILEAPKIGTTIRKSCNIKGRILLNAEPARSSTCRSSVEETVAWIDTYVGRLETEDVFLAGAVGRILAEDVAAAVDVPPFDRAIINGLAVRAGETIGANAYNQLNLRLVAGETLPEGCAMQLNAGNPLPDGADAVVPLELVQMSAAARTCDIVQTVTSGSEVERASNQCGRGDRLLPAERQLRPSDIGLLASAGLTRILVTRRPNVRLVLIGDGLIEPGCLLPSGSIYDANSPLICALIQRDGGILSDRCRSGCDRISISAALSGSEADIILVVGGTGQGPDDQAAAALREAGELAIHGVALRPGGPPDSAEPGRVVPVFLLPGPSLGI
jgi:molybdopterin molybdotransferase